jgi:cellulose synthase/poly-beta-1,6-N-acetylglucosamine synthase-like glycosyltransferase
MIVVFWTLIGLIAYAYIGYPLIILILARIAGRRWILDETLAPSMTLVIPAYNEQHVIDGKLRNALALDYPEGRLEILVASESDDGTDAIVSRFADQGVRLLPSSIRRGKVANQHRAVQEASGEIVVFTDANAMLRMDALRKLARRFADPRVGSVSGRLAYRTPYGTASAYGEEIYWDLEMMVKKASSDLGSLPGANGSLFALRRELYRPISERRGDDFELPIRVILQGRRSVLEPEAVSEEAPARSYRDEYRRKVRIINWMVVSAVILLGEALLRGHLLLAAQLLSHKLNRWAVPFWLIALVPVTLLLAPTGPVYLAAAVVQGVVYTLAAMGLALDRTGMKLPSILGLPFYFAMVNLASLVGILTRLAGRDVRWHKRADGLS